ncbi:MAG TPA: hypothetical protein ENN65_00595 [Candidatus Hydrogenedentes bacterium]|nr:hypothetical protein [Candidatus Hydrogenedentota bacterium]
MNRFGMMAILIAALFLAGCHTFSGVPHMKNALITPEELKPGDTALISVQVKDRHDIVRRVQGVVVEEPRIVFNLRDDGASGDKKAKDGVWSLAVQVPFQAPPGEYLLELTALRSDGTPVPIRDKRGNVSPLKESLPLVIRYEQE